MLRAWIRAFLRFPRVDLVLKAEGRPRRFRTPALTVANNRIADSAGMIPAHADLEHGELVVYVARAKSRLGLVRLALSILFGHWNDNPLLESFAARDIVVRGRRPRLRLSIDGEILNMEQPLHFSIHRGALPTLVPAKP
jgi:diacylglycerol kinase family enzyme